MPRARSTIAPLDPPMPRWWERMVTGTAVVAMIVLAVEGAEVLRHLPVPFWGSLLDGICCAILLTDFLRRLLRSPRRWEFLRTYWMDLVSAIPVIGVPAEGAVVFVARALRVLRLLVLFRRIVLRMETPMPTAVLGYLAVVTGTIWVIAATGFYLFEHGINPAVRSWGDALWWSVTTLSTVGYGDQYPVTVGGRIVAGTTMALGVGVLGTFAGTVGALFLDIREQGRRGLRKHVLHDHLLVLGWSSKASAVIEEFRADPRTLHAGVVIIAELDAHPMEAPGVRFVRGVPHRRDALERASAATAIAAIILAPDALDPRVDEGTALTVHALRRINPTIRISAELIDSDNREHLEAAGCNAIIDVGSVAASMIARGVQDIGVEQLVTELLTSNAGSELYRYPIDKSFVGKTWREYAHSVIEQGRVLVGLSRGGRVLVNPPPDEILQDGDDAFVVSREAPM